MLALACMLAHKSHKRFGGARAAERELQSWSDFSVQEAAKIFVKDIPDLSHVLGRSLIDHRDWALDRGNLFDNSGKKHDLRSFLRGFVYAEEVEDTFSELDISNRRHSCKGECASPFQAYGKFAGFSVWGSNNGK
jgi:hypothetical protein